MNQKALPAVGAGVAGLIFGAAAVVVSAPVLAALAAACSLATGLLALGLAHSIDTAEAEATNAIELMVARELEHSNSENQVGIIDSKTNLPTIRFFELAVKARVASARRHLWPVSVVLLEFGFSEYATDESKQQHEEDSVETFTNLIRRTLREADIVCRTANNVFALILEDTSEEGAVWTAERLQIALSKEAIGIKELSAGIATYPTHALKADEMIKRAHSALSRAKACKPLHGLGQVEVAHLDLS
jgi:diguanylate cyclase (GGDEF)-like protein